jgi:surface protein
MALKIGDNFDYQGKQSNFNRDSFATLEEMKNYPSTSLDEGHISYCSETKTRYIFSSSNTPNTTTGLWATLVDTELDESSENSIQNKAVANKFKELESGTTENLGKVKTELEKADTDILNNLGEDEKSIAQITGEIKDGLKELEQTSAGALNNIRATMATNNTKINGYDLGSDISLTKSDIGLGNVDNTSDISKPISTATQTALNTKVDKKTGYSLVPDSDITKLAGLPTATTITNNLSAHTSRTDNPHSVTAAQVGLGSYASYTATTLPVSGPQQTALDKKVDKTTTINSIPLSSNITLTKGDIGLAQVDNTSDLNKPVSGPQQTALDLKANNTDLESDEKVVAVTVGDLSKTVKENEDVVSKSLNEINQGLDRVDRKISASEIARLSTVTNYDDTAVKKSISDEITRATTIEATKVDKVTGKSLISDTEITRLASVTNYNDTTIKSNIATNTTNISTNTTNITRLNTNTGVTEYPTFSASTAYTAGTIVIYSESLRRFTVAHAAGSWITTDNEAYSLNKLIVANATAISTETTRAKAAETTLQTNIDSEVTRAKAAEKTNADNITALQTNSINSISVGTTSTVPQLKIDTTTFNWMLSTDGGTTWTDLGVASKQATSSAAVVQVTGTSTTDVMSQKAVTDAIANASVNVSDIYKCFDGFTNLIYKKTDGTIVKKSNIPSGAIWKSALAGDTEIEEIYSMPSLTGVTSIWGLFQNDTNLTYVNAEKWDTTSVTNMYGCFNGTAITELDLSGWDTSAVTSMSDMFSSIALH